MVTEIGINKDGMPVQHESLAVLVQDMDTTKFHEFLIQRVPSKHSYASRFSYFCEEADSSKVLESIKKAIWNMRSVKKQTADTFSEAIDAEAIPLLLLRDGASSNEAETDTPPPSPLVPPLLSKQMSLKDVISTSLVSAASAARTASRSVSCQSMAKD